MTLLRIILKRLSAHPVLMALYIGSMVLCVALLTSPSLFADSVSQAIMRDELAESANLLHRPTFAVRFYSIPNSSRPLGLKESDQIRAWLAHYLASGLGIPVRTTYVQNESPAFRLQALDNDTRYTQKDLAEAKVVVVPNLGKHLETVSGVPYGSSGGDSSVLNVWVLESFASELGLKVGEAFRLTLPTRSVRPIDLRVAGVVRPTNLDEEFWYLNPDTMLANAVLTTEQEYNTFVVPVLPEGVRYLYWYYVFDDSRLNLSYATRYISVLERIRYEVDQRLPNGRMDMAPLEELTKARERKRDLSLILTALAIPMLLVLVQFLVIVSRTYARSSARVDATVMSRGASRSQLLVVTVAEAVICLIVALPLGLLLGVQLAKALGLANGFLLFAKRETAPVFLAALDWQPVAAAIAIGLFARIWTSNEHASSSIIAYERAAAGRGAVMTGIRLFTGILLAALTLYTFRQLIVVGKVPLIMTADTTTFIDPLLLLAPGLFLITVPLVLAESTALLVGIFSRILDPVLSAPAAVAFRQMARERNRSRAPVFILVASLSLGVFYASLAYSSQIWTRDRIRHKVGADITFDYATLGGQSLAGTSAGGDAWLLPATEYERIEGVERATRVANYDARIRVGGNERRIKLIGIERLNFPAVAYLRPDYTSQPFGEVMNLLAIQPRGALVPKAIARQYGLNIGDQINLSLAVGDATYSLGFTIVGVLNYFPTVNENELAAVVNIESIFESVGQVLPHSIWIR
ncbi:MAG: ABC transporter permease family protein, partial [Anaerolineae bacterium]